MAPGLFDSLGEGKAIDKEIFEAELAQVRVKLVQVQERVRESGQSVAVVVSGVDGAGKGDLVNAITEWFDPRGVVTYADGIPTDHETRHPGYWRFWMALPPRGKIGLFFGSWYTRPVSDRVMEGGKETTFERALERIEKFERMLAADGMVLIKLWLHLSRKDQKKRFKELGADPATAWRVTRGDWKRFKKYDEFVPVCERAIGATSYPHAPWMLVDAADPRHRDLAVARHLLETLERRIGAAPLVGPPPLAVVKAGARKVKAAKPRRHPLDALDMGAALDQDRYRKELRAAQGRLNELGWEAFRQGRPLVVAFEGWDAAGKGGAIRRVTTSLDAKLYKTVSIAAPTDEERAHHYLWRFWRHIPLDGRTAVFDRTWYGRVLVERVEGFAKELEWRRAYDEINEFETQLVEHGTIICKFWLHITKEEQLKRFEEREATAYKRYKITAEDWRNREKWDQYMAAVRDMVALTDTPLAPWHLIAANDKRHARVAVLQTICRAIQRDLD